MQEKISFRGDRAGDNPIFHNFQGNCTKVQKTTSTKACNSSVLPAYHLNKSVSGETKDKEKLPAVPDSLCWTGCRKKPTPQQNIFALEVGGRERGEEGISSKTLQARTIRTFLYFVWEWISSALPARQQSLEMPVLSASYWLSPAWEDAKPPHITSQGLRPGTLWNPTKLTTSNSLLLDFLLANKILKKSKYFPTSAIWVKCNIK